MYYIVDTTYTKKFGLHFAKELPTVREFGNFVDCYAVAVKKDSSDNDPSGFKSLFESDPAHFVVKHSSISKHCTKNLARNLKSHARQIKLQDKSSNGF